MLKNAVNVTYGTFREMIGQRMKTLDKLNQKYTKIVLGNYFTGKKYQKNIQFGAQYGFYRGFFEFLNT
ncbi:MAG: hypothetical protein OEL84_02260 [Nitrosopumilus sp.]|nr:hypothetical protein [Nitrosopumilus sp.]MDH3340091.1 hypothetical protein [Nitrosopumilus sp.]